MGNKGLEKIKQAHLSLTNQILEDMKRDGQGWVKEWIIRPPFNPVSGTCYSGRNTMLLREAIRIRGYDDPRWVTFSQAKSQGWHIKRGSKSVAIEKWLECWVKKDESGVLKRIRTPRSEEERARYQADSTISQVVRLVGCYNLFNANDVEGIKPLNPLPDTTTIDRLLELSPVKVVERYQDKAFYSPSFDTIMLPTRSQFKSETTAALVLAHEITHATIKPERLNRVMNTDRSSPTYKLDYAREELVASLGSLFILSELGYKGSAIDLSDPLLREHTMNEAQYIASWASGLENPEKEILKAASAASHAAEYICHPELREKLHEQAAKNAPNLDTLKQGLAEKRDRERRRPRGISR